jgi:hypothetical protein
VTHAPPRTPRPRASAIALVALAACRATTATTAPPTTATPITTSERSADAEVLVRAVEAPAMPTCEATDAITAAALSEGVSASPALARRSDGGLVAFVTDPHGDGATKIDLLGLGAQGSPSDESGATRPLIELADMGVAPNLPALAPWREGYLLAWRAGAAGQHRIMVRTLDARGIPTGDARAVGTAGWLGAPSLLVRDDHWHIAVARSATRVANAGADDGIAWASHLDLIADDGTVRSATAPDGGAFDGSAPTLVNAPHGPRIYATAMRRNGAPGDERALLAIDDGAVTMVARDLDHPAALAVEGGVLMAWRARMSRHEASMRSALLPFEGEAPAPPVTLSTYRGAFDARVSLVPLGRDLIGAFTVSTLADDGAGSLNASLLDTHGRYIGRAPLLTGFPTRRGRVVAAAAPEGASDDSAWFAIDGRDADGSGPELLLTRAHCDTTRPRERLDVPPGTFTQDLSAPDAAPLSLARNAPEMSCQTRSTGTFTPHVSGVDNGLAGTSAGVAVTASGAVLMAITKADAAAHPKLMLSTLDAQGHLAPARAVMDDPAHLLALEPVAGGALAVVTYTVQDTERLDLVYVRTNGVTHARLPAGLRNASSAVITRTGAVFVVGESDAGDTLLAQIPWTAGRAGTAVLLARLRAGDAVLDATRQGAETLVLVSRPDAMGADVAQSIARVRVPDGARPTEAVRDARDPFADPIGHARGAVVWATVANAPALVYDERNTLRLAELSNGQTHAPRSVVEVLPGGGEVLSSSWSGSARWLCLSTGYADEQHASMRAITLASIDERGEGAVSTRLPDDANAIAEGTVIGASGDRVVMVYPRNEPRGGVRWAWTEATCSRAGGGR